jgi:hypothetical protein
MGFQHHTLFVLATDMGGVRDRIIRANSDD